MIWFVFGRKFPFYDVKHFYSKERNGWWAWDESIAIRDDFAQSFDVPLMPSSNGNEEVFVDSVRR